MKTGPTARALASLGTADCVLWTGARIANGYGMASTGVSGKTTTAHRRIYELAVGPVPEGMHLDHLCAVRLCVNPAHLEPVTVAENNRRMRALRQEHDPETHCRRGHQWSLENTGSNTHHARICRTCKREGAALRKSRLSLGEPAVGAA